MHAIRKLRESGHATAADYEAILAANVVFHSPVLIRAVEGRAAVAKIFAASTTLREGAYTGEWKLDDRRTLLRWSGKIQGHHRRKRGGAHRRSHSGFSSNACSETFSGRHAVCSRKLCSRRFLGIFKLELQWIGDAVRCDVGRLGGRTRAGSHAIVSVDAAIGRRSAAKARDGIKGLVHRIPRRYHGVGLLKPGKMMEHTNAII